MKFAIVTMGIFSMAFMFELLPSMMFMPLQYIMLFHWMALIVAMAVIFLVLLRAYSTGAYYLMDFPDPARVLWFLFRKGGNIRITPSRRLASFPFLYNKKMKKYEEETGKVYHCAGHPVVPIIEGIDHVVDPRMVAGITKIAETLDIDASDYQTFRNKMLEKLAEITDSLTQKEGLADEQRKELEEKRDTILALRVPDGKKEMELVEWIKQNPLPENLYTIDLAGEPFDPSEFEKYFTNVMSQTNFEAILNMQEAVIIQRDKTYKPQSFSSNAMMWAMILAFIGAILIYSVYSMWGH